MMAGCEICNAPLQAGQCPDCSDALRARYTEWKDAAFPFTAQPPAGSVDPFVMGRLRRALLEGDFAQAESIWTGILPALRPMGATGRAQLAEALEALAILKDHLGKGAEATRLRQRAQTARKDPSTLRFKQSKDEAHRWDDHAWLRAQADGPDPGKEARIAAVEAELEAQLRAKEKLSKGFTVGALGLAGAVAGPLAGIPFGISGALGAGLGWAWSRRR